VKLALDNALRRLDEAMSLRERVRPLRDRLLARPGPRLEKEAQTALGARARYSKGREHSPKSIWVIASPMRWRRIIGRRCCSRRGLQQTASLAAARHRSPGGGRMPSASASRSP